MSGHSKWATTKHKKAALDAKRGKLFAKLIKNIEVAARTGGGDPDANPTLFDAIQKAKKNSVPADNVERARKLGAGEEAGGADWEEITYEGYGANGVAVLIECLTDNKNRAAGEVRTALTRNGGSLADPGSVAYLFTRKGIVIMSKGDATEDDVLMAVLDAGAEEVNDLGESFEIVSEPGDLVAVEETGYQRAVQAFVRAGMRVVGVPIDGEGLRTDLVPPGARLVYCSPAHQYPMGCRMSASRRVELTELARRRDMLVVEDDYDGELRYDVAPLPLLASLAPDVVVHLGTTSKILTPTLGAGWMVAPPPVTQAVLEHRELTGTRPSPAGQHVVVELARHGDLGRHLRRLRRELSDRRTILVEAFARAGVRVLGDDAGAHLVVPLATAEGERETIAAGKRSGVLLDGLARHFASTPTAHGVLVGYAGCSRTELAECVPTLVELSRNGPR